MAPDGTAVTVLLIDCLFLSPAVPSPMRPLLLVAVAVAVAVVGESEREEDDVAAVQ